MKIDCNSFAYAFLWSSDCAFSFFFMLQLTNRLLLKVTGVCFNGKVPRYAQPTFKLNQVNGLSWGRPYQHWPPLLWHTHNSVDLWESI